MAFNKPLPDWHAQGVEPPQSLRNAGWDVGQKPPADYFNWIQFRTYEALKELQEKAGEIKTINGQSPDASGNIDIDTSEIEQEIANLEGYIGNLTELTTEQKESLVAAINEVKQNIVDNSSDIATLNQELTSYKNSYTTHIGDESAHGIGNKSDLLTAEKSTIVGALNELFTNVSNGKQLIGGAITDVDPDVIVPAEPTFQQLVDAIGKIYTGPKFAYGDIVSDADNSFQITGLGFRPAIVFVGRNDNPSPSQDERAAYGSGDLIGISGDINLRRYNYSTTGQYASNAFTINDTGFVFQGITSTWFNPYRWVAIGYMDIT